MTLGDSMSTGRNAEPLVFSTMPLGLAISSSNINLQKGTLNNLFSNGSLNYPDELKLSGLVMSSGDSHLLGERRATCSSDLVMSLDDSNLQRVR